MLLAEKAVSPSLGAPARCPKAPAKPVSGRRRSAHEVALEIAPAMTLTAALTKIIAPNVRAVPSADWL
jgi:hypothetical protein